jgi:hypothetical protein
VSWRSRRSPFVGPVGRGSGAVSSTGQPALATAVIDPIYDRSDPAMTHPGRICTPPPRLGVSWRGVDHGRQSLHTDSSCRGRAEGRRAGQRKAPAPDACLDGGAAAVGHDADRRPTQSRNTCRRAGSEAICQPQRDKRSQGASQRESRRVNTPRSGRGPRISGCGRALNLPSSWRRGA